jgi:hypothetical protein
MFSVGSDSWLREAFDLWQEHSNVKPCKEEGRRQSHSLGQLNARTGVKSYKTLKEDEKKAAARQLKRKRPLSSKESEAELEDFMTALQECKAIVTDILSNKEPRRVLAGTAWEIQDIRRVYHRDVNATQKLYETSVSIIIGLIEGDDVAFPEVPYPPQTCPQKQAGNVTGLNSRKATRNAAEAASRKALALAMERDSADIHPDSTMLATDLSKAGNGKSRILETIIGVIGNSTCEIGENEFGYNECTEDLRRPFVFSQRSVTPGPLLLVTGRL